MWAGPAVDADDVHGRALEGRQRRDRRGAVGQLQLLAERQLGDDRQVRRGTPRLVGGDEQVAQVHEGLEDQQVHAALEQAVDLLAERLADPRLVEAHQVAGRRAERPDRAGDEHVTPGDIPRLAGDARRGPVEPVCLAREAVNGEPDPIGTERRGLDDVRSCLQVRPVDRTDELRPGRRQLVEAGTLGDAAGEEERAHRAVGEEWTRRESLPETLPTVHGPKPTRGRRTIRAGARAGASRQSR